LINCLNALCAQHLEKSAFEVIVVSDGPDHKTAQLLTRWLKKKKINLTFLYTEEKKGPAGARNLGWLNARAPLIAFTDDDCLPEKNWLKSFLALYDGQDLIAYTGKTIVPVKDTVNDFAANTARLENAEFITANCACTKMTLTHVGGFDERFKLAWREDSDLQFNLLSNQVPIIKVQGAIVTHPVRDAAWGISVKEQKKGIYDALLFKKFPDLYRSKVQAAPLFDYYLIILLWLALLVSIAVEAVPAIMLTAIALAVLLGKFLFNRLRNTSKSIDHVFEMLVTSMVIPFISVFWRMYGAIKFRVFFI